MPAKHIRTQIEVLELAEGFFRSRMLFALHRLGIFRLLGNEKQSLQELAEATATSSSHLERLLNAGQAFGLLKSEGDVFSLEDRFVPILSAEESESYLGNWLNFLDFLYEAVSDLDRAVSDGGPTVDLLKSKQDRDIREFTLAMHNYSALRGREIADFLDTSACASLLDLGCGPGSYAFHLGLKNPRLTLHLLDLPDVLKVTREIQAHYPIRNAVRYLPLDVEREKIPGTYDLILISNTLHMLGERASRQLLRRLRGSLTPGGSVVIQAQYLDDDRKGGKWPVLLDLIQLCITSGGRNHTVAETREWLEEAGYSRLEFHPMTVFNTNSFLRGYRM